MFVCANCSKQEKPNQPSYLFPTKLRSKVYPRRESANKYTADKGKQKKAEDPGGSGLEIQKEILVCKDCYDLLSKAGEN